MALFIKGRGGSPDPTNELFDDIIVDEFDVEFDWIGNELSEDRSVTFFNKCVSHFCTVSSTRNIDANEGSLNSLGRHDRRASRALRYFKSYNTCT